MSIFAIYFTKVSKVCVDAESIDEAYTLANDMLKDNTKLIDSYEDTWEIDEITDYD